MKSAKRYWRMRLCGCLCRRYSVAAVTGDTRWPSRLPLDQARPWSRGTSSVRMRPVHGNALTPCKGASRWIRSLIAVRLLSNSGDVSQIVDFEHANSQEATDARFEFSFSITSKQVRESAKPARHEVTALVLLEAEGALSVARGTNRIGDVPDKAISTSRRGTVS